MFMVSLEKAFFGIAKFNDSVNVIRQIVNFSKNFVKLQPYLPKDLLRITKFGNNKLLVAVFA